MWAPRRRPSRAGRAIQRRRGAATPRRSNTSAWSPGRACRRDRSSSSRFCTRDHSQGAIALAVRDGRRTYGPEEVGLARDLAGRAAIALDNARLYRDVQENNRRKNEFLAMLAHELRNPLAPIRNAVEILRLLDIPDPNLQWANDIITRQVEQLVRLVDDLLDISRITGGKIQLRKESVDVALAVARAVETSRPLIDARRHELCVAVPDHPIFVAADLVRLSQVLSNLLNNAAKYTEEGGRISLEVERERADVVFRVRDNGIGISPEMVSSIFDLFIQVNRSIDRSQGGLGVGLTLVRQLVEMHGGSVQAQSEGQNRGSEFVVPPAGLAHGRRSRGCGRTARPAGGAVVPPSDPHHRGLSGRRREPAADAPPGGPRGEGLPRRSRRHGGAGRRAPRHHPPRYRPAGHGRVRRGPCIRQRPGSESIVLVALTGHGQEEDRRRSAEAGFDHHLTKPVDPAALFSLVSSVPRRADARAAFDSVLSPV